MNEHDKIITFQSFYDFPSADKVIATLEGNGISCFIADSYTLWALPYYNTALGGIKIKIFESDLGRCREILAAQSSLPEEEPFEKDNTLYGLVKCPNCASTNVRYGITTELKFHLVSLFVSLFFWVPLYLRNTWHCFNCGCNFDTKLK